MGSIYPIMLIYTNPRMLSVPLVVVDDTVGVVML